ncbi:MAG: matrixin family metalloprotease, partial [Chitinophagaceae bacterium]
ADTLLRILSGQKPANVVRIGLTAKDISTTKGTKPDWGIMGLGSSYSKTCIVSTFRLSAKHRQDQLFKVVVHELGHTEGLEHCPVKTCFMRDAEGSNHTDEETGFCDKCKDVLKSRGWVL